MSSEIRDTEAQPSPDLAPDLDLRVLCADGACIGVIGKDGLCKVCQAPIAPEDIAAFEAATGSVLGSEFVRPSSNALPPADAEGWAADRPRSEPNDLFDDTPPDLDGRVLCSDGACIGVIGEDNRCKVCNTPYSDSGVA